MTPREDEAGLRTVLRNETRTNDDTADTQGTETIQTSPGTDPAKEAVIGTIAGTITDPGIITDHGIVTEVRGVTAEGDTTTGRETGPRKRNRIKTGGLDTTAKTETRASPDRVYVGMKIIMTIIETDTTQQTGEETTEIDDGTTAGEEPHSEKHERNRN